MKDAHGIGRAAGHFHVEAGVDEVDGVGRAPVRGHEAFEADFVAQDSGERRIVAAGEGAVDAVIGAHDGRDAGFDRGIERGHVDFVQRLVVDEDVGARSSRSRRSA